MINMDSQTQVRYREQWIVVIDKERHPLTGEQMRVLKQKIASGDRGFIDFGEFGFAVSHISSYWLETRQIANQLTAPEKTYELTPEQREKGRIKLEEIRKERFSENQVA